MIAPGGALNTERTLQASSIDEGSAQQRLDLWIADAQLVRCPTIIASWTAGSSLTRTLLRSEAPFTSVLIGRGIQR
jgi:hypothetical protein